MSARSTAWGTLDPDAPVGTAAAIVYGRRARYTTAYAVMVSPGEQVTGTVTRPTPEWSRRVAARRMAHYVAKNRPPEGPGTGRPYNAPTVTRSHNIPKPPPKD